MGNGFTEVMVIHNDYEKELFMKAFNLENVKYEVLKHTEDLALEYGILTLEDNYEKLATDEARAFFKDYTIQDSKLYDYMRD